MGDLALFGHDLFGEVVKPKAAGVVADRFTMPPFSVLDARSGDWQARKRAWRSIGIRGEEGRDEDLAGASWGAEWMKRNGDGCDRDTNGTSIFDPVLCELVYRWWCPPRGQILDPFAGGSVRGIIAGSLGLNYWGSDLSGEQVSANIRQAVEIGPPAMPQWIHGDSLETVSSAPDADLIFSCPPYGDLERYSEDPKDLSTMEWHTFCAAYRRIILRSLSKLKRDRFAVFVVGDFRDPRGFYRGFVGETVRAFEEQGARFYNDAIILQATGTAAMRVSRQFGASRKLVKLHQNVLVFCKGDPRAAAEACAGQLDLLEA
jgi:hypothetical protein